MLKARLITAFALGLPALWLVFESSQVVFWWFLFVILVLGMWEWSRLSGIKLLIPRIVGTVLFAVTVVLVDKLNVYAWIETPQVFLFLSFWWLLASFRVVKSSGTVVTLSKPYILFRYLEGVLILLGLMYSLQLLHSQSTGSWLVVILLSLIWGADSFAYFAGRQWGKKKLLPRVSPGKTWAGVMGGALGGTAVSAGIVFLHPVLTPHVLWFIPVIAISIAFSVMGDLFESMYKREVNLKDSGHILPGHGGILDRIDSLLAAAPVFVAGLFLVGVIA